MINPIPEGKHTLTAAMNVKDAAGAIDFLKRAFGAEEVSRMADAQGRVMHSEVKIGDSLMMVSEAMQESETRSAFMLYVADCDAVYRRAIEGGASSLMEPADMFWGDRFARVTDGWGNRWGIGQHIEDVAEDEVRRRGEAFMASQAKPA